MKQLVDYDHNALFITLDSFGYDTFNDASSPVMKNVCKVRKAEA